MKGMMPALSLTGCDLGTASIPYPSSRAGVAPPGQSVRLCSTPLSAAATVCLRTASRSPSNWNKRAVA